MSSMNSIFLRPDETSYNTVIVALPKHASSPSFAPTDTIGSAKNDDNSSITERTEILIDEMIHMSKEQQQHK
eukprot:15358334-Ditylum_brightwellii.AAC.1